MNLGMPVAASEGAEVGSDQLNMSMRNPVFDLDADKVSLSFVKKKISRERESMSVGC